MPRERTETLCAIPVRGDYDYTVKPHTRHATCKHCGRMGLIWRTTHTGKYIPTTHESGEFHECTRTQTTSTQAPQTPVQAPPAPQTIDIDAIARLVESRITLPPQVIDYDRIVATATALLASQTPTPITLTPYNAPSVTIENPHPSMAQLLYWVAARRNVWLFGPAGSGKTTAVVTVANALGLRYGIMSCGPMTQEYGILGYRSADGTFIPGAVYDYYENGGVFGWDEIGAASPDCMTVVNALLANHECMFGGRMVKKHPDFVSIAADNTNGNGASTQYTARSQQDAALLDRFEFIEWGYDAHLERRIAQSYEHPDALRWHDYVLRVREICERLSIPLVVSTRAIISGCEGLRVGLTFDQIASARFWNRLDSDSVQRIKANL